jgi:hypothetical protein
MDEHVPHRVRQAELVRLIEALAEVPDDEVFCWPDELRTFTARKNNHWSAPCPLRKNDPALDVLFGI